MRKKEIWFFGISFLKTCFPFYKAKKKKRVSGHLSLSLSLSLSLCFSL